MVTDITHHRHRSRIDRLSERRRRVCPTSAVPTDPGLLIYVIVPKVPKVPKGTGTSTSPGTGTGTGTGAGAGAGAGTGSNRV